MASYKILCTHGKSFCPIVLLIMGNYLIYSSGRGWKIIHVWFFHFENKAHILKLVNMYIKLIYILITVNSYSGELMLAFWFFPWISFCSPFFFLLHWAFVIFVNRKKLIIINHIILKRFQGNYLSRQFKWNKRFSKKYQLVDDEPFKL